MKNEKVVVKIKDLHIVYHAIKKLTCLLKMITNDMEKMLSEMEFVEGEDK